MDNFNDSFTNLKATGAEIKNPALGESLNSLLQGDGAFFGRLLPALVGMAFVVGVVVFLFMIITGAIQWISSGGDKQALEAARGKISNALIGIVILFASFAIINLIEIFFGIKILALDIGLLKI